MSEETLFLNTLVNAYPDNVPDPFFSRWVNSFNKQIRYNVKLKKVANMALGLTETRVFTPVGLALADWSIIVARVVGSARIETAGFDTDGTTAITGHTPLFGNSLLPGYALWSTYNVTSFTMLALADNTVVELFQAISEED